MELRHVEHVHLAHAMNGKAEARLIGLIAGLFVLRLAAAALLPLSADEAYYWLWSRHLAAGYYDHPPAIAFIIRFGTFFFGDSAFGVRIGAVLLSFAASLFVWRAAFLLTGSRRAGWHAALLFNLTVMVAIEALAATPDAPAIFAAAAFFWALAEFARARDGRWWLAAGLAGGLALLSKYTGFFLGAGALVWLALSPPMRKSLATIWPWLGAALALVIFLPNLLWNMKHDWATFAFQFGRAGRGGLSWTYFPDFLGSQLALATPFVLIAGLLALVGAWRFRSDKRFLPLALCLPAAAYFLEHTTHARVQGNWPSFLYPMLAVAAADRRLIAGFGGFWRKTARWSARLAAPVALVLLIATYAQALFAVIPLGRKDPLARLLAVGLPEVTARIDDLRRKENAAAILTSDYATTAWFAFYAPKGMVVAQIGEEFRYLDAPPLPEALAARPLLYVTEIRRRARGEILRDHFSEMREIARIERTRKHIPIARYIVYRVAGPKHAAIGRVP